MKNPFLKEILLSNINSLLGALLLGSVGLGASVLMWQVAFGYNPLAQAFIAAAVVDIYSI